MNIKKLIILASVLSLGVLSFSSCGTNGDSSSESSAAVSDSESSSKSESTKDESSSTASSEKKNEKSDSKADSESDVISKSEQSVIDNVQGNSETAKVSGESDVSFAGNDSEISLEEGEIPIIGFEKDEPESTQKATKAPAESPAKDESSSSETEISDIIDSEITVNEDGAIELPFIPIEDIIG